MADQGGPGDLLGYLPGAVLFGWFVVRMLRDYRGNALVTLGTITLALTIGFSFVVGDSRLPAWLSYGAVAVIGGFALSTLFFAVWRPRAPGRRAKR